MTKRSADVYEELERTTQRYHSVIKEHDSAKGLADALAKEREAVRRRLIELDEETHQQPLLALLQQMAPIVQRAAADDPDSCFFACMVCRERFPYAVSPAVTDAQHDETVADLARWLGSWQMRFACGHSICRLCYARLLKSVFTPDLLSTSTGLGIACPCCKKPRYVFLIDEDEHSWSADDELLALDNPLHITTAPTPTPPADDALAVSDDDDNADFVPSSSLSSSSSSASSTSANDTF